MKQILLFFLVNLPLLVFSQFQEAFDGPDITSRNAWQGDLSDFIINENGWLELVGDSEKSSSQLQVSLAFSDTMVWQFDVKMDFIPSNYNHIRFNLLTDRLSIVGIDETYYVQIGSNNKTISLRRLRETESSSKRYIEQELDILKTENVKLRVKVTLENSKKWTLYVQEAGKSFFSTIGTFEQELQSRQLKYIKSGFDFHYSSKKRGHYIDNIEISSQIIPTAEPEIPTESEVQFIDIEALTYASAKLYFSAPINIENATFYAEGEGFEGKEMIDRKKLYNENSVIIDFPQELSFNTPYTFYWEGIVDELGLPIKDGNVSVKLVNDESEEEEEETPETPEEQPEDPIETYPEKAIRINEVMADPDTCGWPEYVELYNTQDKTISLDGWIFDYGNGYKRKGLDGFSIPANGYVILFHAKHTDIFPENIAIPIETFPQLSNDGKALALYAGEKCIDSYSYPQAKPACSWEYDEEGWHLSTDPRGGTPGESNSEPTTTKEEPEEEPDEPETPVVPEEPEQPEESYPKGSVIIHEVMADPKGLTALPETEYIELYNKVDQSIDLSNWILNYGTTPIALTGVVIPAHGWVVLYRSGREIEVGSGQACPLDKFPSALANTGKELSLYDANSQLMDQYTYPKAKPACSWEYDEEGWHLSSDPRGGTPGEANSEAEENEEDPDETPDEPEEEINPEPEIPEAQQPQPGDIIINELLPEPFVDGSEYIELYNRSEQELSLKDVCISTRKSDGSLNTRYPLEAYPQTLQAGDYLLLTKSIEGVENFYSLPASLNWLECKLPVLSNTGSTVVLYRGEGEIIIDEVSYSPKWHAPTVKNKKGVALERKDPDKDSQNADNWTSAASSAGFGTPGLENSQYLNGETETDSEEIDDPIYQPTGTFQIPYRLNQSGYMARGWIFDLSGRKVALIADNTSLGTQGYLEWNGKGRDGSPVNTGIYIIYLELWHPGGNVIRKKQVLLIP